MKSEDLIRSIGLADDKYVLEAQNPKKTRKKLRFISGVCAACIALALVNLWLFIPFPEPASPIASYIGSEYYPVIERLYLNTEALKNKLPYSNNFEKILYNLSYVEKNPGNSITTDSINGIEGEYSPPTYIETTDNQNEGVIEGDRIKRSDQYIYYVQKDELVIYTIQGENSTLAGSVKLKTSDTEIFLSLDCKYITAVSQLYKAGISTTYICVFDVTNPDNIQNISEITINGGLLESRYSNEHLIVAAEHDIDLRHAIYSEPSTFIPCFKYNTQESCIAMSDIHIPNYEYADYLNYTIIYSLDPQTLEPQSTFALLGGSQSIYFSRDNVFMVANYAKDGTDYCEISCVSYTDGDLEFKCAVEADGHVDDRYWMDELDGVLRVFSDTNENNKENVTLSIIDLKKEKTIAKLKSFAPQGESLRSVRFEGNKAYVCTAIVEEFVVTDPVFFFDLSDYQNISYTDTGTIPGFSLSLIDYKDGDLLGVGFDEKYRQKFELYREENGKVVSKDKIVYSSSFIPREYKAYFIDRERKLFGFEDDLDRSFFNLIEIKDGELHETFIEHVFMGNHAKRTRALLIDNYLYIFTDTELYVHQFETT